MHWPRLEEGRATAGYFFCAFFFHLKGVWPADGKLFWLNWNRCIHLGLIETQQFGKIEADMASDPQGRHEVWRSDNQGLSRTLTLLM